MSALVIPSSFNEYSEHPHKVGENLNFFLKQLGGNIENKLSLGLMEPATLKKQQPVFYQGVQDVPANSEATLLKAVINQPISVAIDAGDYSFQQYVGGVFTGECDDELDHGITVVGYGTSTDGNKYWLVKKSWGSSWGENGYIRMEREIAANERLSGIAMEASYPTS